MTIADFDPRMRTTAMSVLRLFQCRPGRGMRCDAMRASAAAIFDASVCEHVNAAYRTAQSLLRRLTIILRAFSAFSRGGFHAEILVGNLVMQLLSEEPREDFARSTITRSHIRETRQWSCANALAPDTFGHNFSGLPFQLAS
jgi:hypothetical protein